VEEIEVTFQVMKGSGMGWASSTGHAGGIRIGVILLRVD
jgi:hypothetical protein